MAKTTSTTKTKKEKAPDFKDLLYKTIGQTLADKFDSDIYRIKVTGMNECLIITDDSGSDFTVTITQKKFNVDYSDEHVKDTFFPTPLEAEDEYEVEIETQEPDSESDSEPDTPDESV